MKKLIDFYANSFKGLSKDVWSVALIYLINRSGEMVIPFMTVYITNELMWSKTQAGIVLLCFGIGALAGSNIGGYLTDTIGNFKVMTASLFLSGFAFMGILFFQTFYGLCFWMFVTAVCTSSFSPAAFGAMSSWGKPENVTRGISLLRMAINLGVAIGPAIGGFLAFKVGYNWLFIVDGVTCILAGIAMFFVLAHRNAKPKITAEEKANSSSPFKDIKLMLFLFFNLINMVAFFQILFSVPVYFREVIQMDEFWIGLFFTANGILVFLFEMPLVYIIEKKNKYFRPMILGAILIGLGFMSLAIFGNPFVAIVLYSLLIAFGEIINFPLIPSLALRRAKTQDHGKFMGAVSMMFAMAFTLAPISGLPIIEKIGFQNYWYLAASLSILSGIGLAILKVGFDRNRLKTANA